MDSSLTHLCVEALGTLLDEFPGVGGACNCQETLIIDVLDAQSGVLANRGGEEKRIVDAGQDRHVRPHPAAVPNLNRRRHIAATALIGVSDFMAPCQDERSQANVNFPTDGQRRHEREDCRRVNCGLVADPQKFRLGAPRFSGNQPHRPKNLHPVSNVHARNAIRPGSLMVEHVVWETASDEVRDEKPDIHLADVGMPRSTHLIEHGRWARATSHREPPGPCIMAVITSSIICRYSSDVIHGSIDVAVSRFEGPGPSCARVSFASRIRASGLVRLRETLSRLMLTHPRLAQHGRCAAKHGRHVRLVDVRALKGEMMRVLVTGGAGYIGSYMAKLLARAGVEPIVFDNLSMGHRHAVRWGPLIEGDLSDSALVTSVLAEHEIDAVVHFAANAYVGESMQNPRKYFHNNVAGTLSLLDAMVDADVRTIVFSSTCATYGEAETLPIDERHPQRPTNPYGESKLFVERMLHWYGVTYGLHSVALRYFNAAGADLDGEIGEEDDPETHLIPLVIGAALGNRACAEVFGTDYDTPDATAVRDYIHVMDLATAHLLGFDYLLGGGASTAVNLGTGNGHSVRDIIGAVA
jgi:UDP-arabinose 4-epimerase